MKMTRERENQGELVNAGLKWLCGLSFSQNGIVSQLYKLDLGCRLSSRIETVSRSVVYLQWKQCYLTCVMFFIKNT